jgi:diguanylate cyclase (GGDEF)-like protein
MPDTIVCANDEMALGALYALADAGLRVPEDVRISGYDDAYLGRVHEPAITTVVRRDYELAQAAYWKLRTSIMGEESGDDDTIACHAVFRGSCGCPEDAKSLDRDAVRQMQTMDVKNRTYMINFAEILRSSAVDFSMASAYEDLYRYIRKYARMIDVSDFFLCICREPSREVAENGYLQKGEYREAYEFGKCMYAPVAVVDGHDLACGDFETKELLPQAAWDAATSSYFSVMPVHFQDKCFGYVVIGLNASVKDNDLINLFVMNISNAIENVHKQTQLSSMVEKLNRLYIYDNLTGIMNRSGFNKYVDVVLKDARSDELCVCIFFADLDNLKYINDHMGHDEGDRFIRTIAQIMAQNKHHGELLMRYGGDEFVALAPGVDAEEAKRRIAGLMKELEEVNGRRKQHADDMLFDMSVGFIIIPPEEVQAGIDLDVKIEEADQEMYKVKRAKKEKMIRIIAGREDDRRS